MTSLATANTPGYFYAVAYWGAAFLMILFNKKHLTKGQLWFAHILSFLCLVSFMKFTDGVATPLFMPCMLVTITMRIIYLYCCCEFSLAGAGYYCAQAFITGEFIASFGWQIYYYLVVRFDVGTSIMTQIGYLILVYATLFVILYWMERKISGKIEELRITRRELLTVIIIAAAVFLISNMSYVSQHSLFSSQFTSEIFIIRTMVDLAGMAVLYAYHIQVRDLQMKFELVAMQSLLNMQYKNYQLTQESIDIVNQKYHDMKHQIALLKREATSTRATESLNQLEKEIKIYEAQNKTGNKVLDAVLTSKTLYCQNQGIGLTSVADGTALSFMSDMDISALFGNMLDNAIESVEKLDEREKRLIHLKVAKQKNFLRIHIENYCEKQLTFRNGLPVTTKNDHQFHGYGLKSIQSTAKKYGGSVLATMENNWFELSVLIPIDYSKLG